MNSRNLVSMFDACQLHSLGLMQRFDARCNEENSLICLACVERNEGQ